MKKTITLLISLIYLILTVSFTNANVKAINTSVDLSPYYDSDELLIHENYTINDYNKLIGKNGSLNIIASNVESSIYMGVFQRVR